MVFFYKVYIGYIGGTLYSGNSSIGYCIRYCIYKVFSNVYVQGILKGIL